METGLGSSQQSDGHLHTRQPKIIFTLDESQRDAHAVSFKRDGYTTLRNIFEGRSLEIYTTYALMLQANNYFGTSERRQGFYDRYADLLLESILLHLQPLMEQATGYSLLPTYSYLRLYETGAVLNKHTDRHSCEISASLTIGCDAPELWPLWLESNGQPRQITLQPGDMLLYKGRDVPHWREKFEGRHWIQAFFHYVDADGTLTDYKFDKRKGIGVRPK